MKIWFVDDDDEMGQAIRLMLSLLDHEMRQFINPRIAAKSLSQGEKPDLLLLDINMPEVNGIDLLEFIRRNPEWKELPILMISSEATDQQIDECLKLGADGFIGKPVTLDELESAINYVQRKYNMLAQE
jgi:two-component system chemotaxis response regulator CheY